LRPWKSDEGGFVESLRRNLARFAERTGIAVNADLPEGVLSLTEDWEVQLTRVFQEALTNVARHSQATEVRVALKLEGRRLEAEVADNGVGCDPETAMRGFGMASMRQRIEAIGGHLELESSTGTGTRLAFACPGGAPPRSNA
jgi:signal transduction histidine kinase